MRNYLWIFIAFSYCILYCFIDLQVSLYAREIISPLLSASVQCILMIAFGIILSQVALHCQENTLFHKKVFICGVCALSLVAFSEILLFTLPFLAPVLQRSLLMLSRAAAMGQMGLGLLLGNWLRHRQLQQQFNQAQDLE